MKAIEVKKGQTVVYNGEKWNVKECGLNHLIIINSEKQQRITSYSQIEKYEPEQIK